MRRGTWLLALVALLALPGCRKKAVVVETPQAVVTEGSSVLESQMSTVATKFGVPIYPGAKPDSKFSMMPASNAPAERAYLMYVTTDPVEKVLAFYKSQMSLQEQMVGAVAQLKGMTPTGAALTINIARDLTNARTSFTITANAQATTYASQTDMPATSNPYSASANRTYVTPPATATRETGEPYNMTMGSEPAQPSYTPPPPVENPPPQEEQAPPEEPPMSETGNEEIPVHEGPPGEPPL